MPILVMVGQVCYVWPPNIFSVWGMILEWSSLWESCLRRACAVSLNLDPPCVPHARRPSWRKDEGTPPAVQRAEEDYIDHILTSIDFRLQQKSMKLYVIAEEWFCRRLIKQLRPRKTQTRLYNVLQLFEIILAMTWRQEVWSYNWKCCMTWWIVN